MLYVIVAGGGKVGFYLTKTLLAAGYEVLLLEKDREKHRTLAEQLGEAVVHGDGCEVVKLLNVGVTRADIVVAATGDDEDNLVICQMAKERFKVNRVIARINNPKNEAIFHQLGIHETVNGTAVLYHMIEQEVETDTVIPLAALQRGNMELVEAALSRHSPIVGLEMQQVKLPEGSLIVSLIRNGRGALPTATTRLEAGDTLIALVNSDQEIALCQILAGRH
jgi:trk system potassium uptake protein TrkA